jgi:hypothetical protein
LDHWSVVELPDTARGGTVVDSFQSFPSSIVADAAGGLWLKGSRFLARCDVSRCERVEAPTLSEHSMQSDIQRILGLLGGLSPIVGLSAAPAYLPTLLMFQHGKFTELPAIPLHDRTDAAALWFYGNKSGTIAIVSRRAVDDAPAIFDPSVLIYAGGSWSSVERPEDVISIFGVSVDDKDRVWLVASSPGASHYTSLYVRERDEWRAEVVPEGTMLTLNPQNQILAVNDSGGYLWNGDDWIDVIGINASNILSNLYVSPTGDAWNSVGFPDGGEGVEVFMGDEASILTARNSPLESDRVIAVTGSDTGRIWVYTLDGIVAFDPRDELVQDPPSERSR